MLQNMKSVTYTNARGESLTIGSMVPYYGESYDGLGAVQHVISTSKSPGQDGVSLGDITRDKRNLVIEGTISAQTAEHLEECKQKMLRVFGQKQQGLLVYKKGAIQRQIQCVTEFAPYFAPTQLSLWHLKYQISLLAPDPDWQSTIEYTQEIVTWIGGLRFPIRTPTRFAKSGPTRINIINHGDTATPIRAEFVGPATRPRITNETTGEYIEVEAYIESGQTLVVTTGFNDKRITIDGMSKFQLKGQGSTFFWLQPGDNIISYTSDDSTETAQVKVSWRDRYLGV